MEAGGDGELGAQGVQCKMKLGRESETRVGKAMWSKSGFFVLFYL